MATLASPVELPTSRNSYQYVGYGDDIKNPQWIPILRKTESQCDPSQEKELSPYTGASFSPIPTYTADSPDQRPKPSSIHSYSRSSVAPETVEFDAISPPPPVPLPPLPPIPQESSKPTNIELPATRPTSRYYEKTHITGMSGDATVTSTDTETTVDMSRTESNAGTSTTTDDAPSQQAPVAVKDETPVRPPPAVEEEAPSLYPRSTRSSYSSSKKYSIGPPTSKFNRKPAPALPSRITSLQSEANASLATPIWKTTPGHSRSQTPAPSPRLATAQQEQPLNLSSSPATSPKKASSIKPTSSNASLASRSSSDNSPPPAVSTSTPGTQRPIHLPQKSTASAKSQQTKSDLKGLAPSLPPAITMQQKGRDGVAAQPEQTPVIEKPENARIERPETARLAPQPRLGPSSGISSFMTANDTVIFRRFDEVHVQLLLCLQDEITQLERELMRLETAVLTRSERDIERSRVMKELRKVVAEYGKSYPLDAQSASPRATTDLSKTTSSLPGVRCRRAKHPKRHNKVYERGWRDLRQARARR